MTGSSLPEWLETTNVVTGLYPFMSMAKVKKTIVTDYATYMTLRCLI